jgi:hypothetical protein
VISDEEISALDLHEGDLVRYVQDGWKSDTYLVGRLHSDEHGCLMLLNVGIKTVGYVQDPQPFTLEVIERAPRPYYCNHPRKEPVAGDVIRDGDTNSRQIWVHTGYGWITLEHGDVQPPGNLPENKILLVDGDTGQVVVPGRTLREKEVTS